MDSLLHYSTHKGEGKMSDTELAEAELEDLKDLEKYIKKFYS